MVRITNYRSKWNELIAHYGVLCFYCEDAIATTIDHVIPYAHDQDDSIENLVPACALCNFIANDRIFEDTEHKRQYILSRRTNRNRKRAICTECYLPYAYRIHSPSLFLCAECYDREYDTDYAQQKVWRRWLSELTAAGIYPEAHRYARRKYGACLQRYRKFFIEAIADGYSEIIESRELVVR